MRTPTLMEIWCFLQAHVDQLGDQRNVVFDLHPRMMRILISVVLYPSVSIIAVVAKELGIQGGHAQKRFNSTLIPKLQSLY